MYAIRSYYALFIAYAPAEQPKIALAVLVENGGFGAQSAAPIARMVMDYYLLGKSPQGAAKEDESARITSYNVCYTKLLRSATTARNRFIDVGQSSAAGCR